MGKMKKKLAAAAMVGTFMSVAITGCAENASVISRQIAREADDFDITRKVTIINTRTGDSVYEQSGNIAVTVSSGRLDILVKEGDQYKKHIIGLDRDLAFIVEDLEGLNAGE